MIKYAVMLLLLALPAAAKDMPGTWYLRTYSDPGMYEVVLKKDGTGNVTRKFHHTEKVRPVKTQACTWTMTKDKFTMRIGREVITGNPHPKGPQSVRSNKRGPARLGASLNAAEFNARVECKKGVCRDIPPRKWK